MTTCMTRKINVTPKTTEHDLIVRSVKSEAEVIILEDCIRRILLLTQRIARPLCNSRAILVSDIRNSYSRYPEFLISEKLGYLHNSEECFSDIQKEFHICKITISHYFVYPTFFLAIQN